MARWNWSPKWRSDIQRHLMNDAAKTNHISASEPATRKKRKGRIVAQKIVSADFAVTTVNMTNGGFRKQPCKECPWRKDIATHVFPEEAFRTSANTACDASTHIFGCHMSSTESPVACAGFLLRNADNNVAVRIATAFGRFDPADVSSSFPLYDSYRDMAIANGVAPDDPSLSDCRGNADPAPRPRRNITKTA